MLRHYVANIPRSFVQAVQQRAIRTTAATRASPTNAGNSNQRASVLDALTATTSQFKTYKPVTPGLRHLRRPISAHLYEGSPIRDLTIAQRKKGGRNVHGRITVRHIGGGHRRRLRNVDFVRSEGGIQDVIRIEFDPGRSAHIALIKNRDPNAQRPLSYILACDGLRAGDVVQSFRTGIPDGLVPGFTDSHSVKKKNKTAEQLNAVTADVNANPSSPQTVEPPETSDASEAASVSLSLGVLRAITIKPGNVLPLRLIPTSTQIHAISLRPHGPGVLVRSAGSFGQVVAHDDIGRYTQVKLQSGEVRNVLQTCAATIGKVSNSDWKNRSLGKAGRSRWLGKRPSVRGVAMNAVDHPHGGGRGKSKGNKHPRSIWGWGTKGTRTRKPSSRGGNTMVVKERPRGKEKRSN